MVQRFLILTLTLFLACIYSVSFASPVFDAQECITNFPGDPDSLLDWPNTDALGGSSPLTGYDDGDPIYFYIEEDIGEEIKNCLNSSLEANSPIRHLSDSAANRQVINSIVTAAEVWNQESRSAVLVYAGTVSSDSIDTACSQFDPDKLPAIFVNFKGRCKGTNPTFCESSAIGTTTKRFMILCKNAVDLFIWGDPDTPNKCTDNALDWYINGVNSQLDIVSLLVHEFGHALGLWHPSEVVGGDPSNGNSVMNTSQSHQIWIRRHLFPWDTDCSDDPVLPALNHHRERRKVIEYRWQRFKDSGSEHGNVVNSSKDVVKGFCSGGYLRDDMDRYYGLYDDDSIRTSFVNSDGNLSFSSEPNFTIEDLTNPGLYIAPVLMTPLEHSGANQDHRITFNDTRDGASSPYTLNDPPEVKYIRSNDFFVSQFSGPFNYKYCTNSTCSQTQEVQTHIPLVSSWDDFSGNTVFAFVQTNRDFSGHGQIYLIPGYFSGSNLNLREPVPLSTLTPPNDPYQDMAFSLKSQVRPGIACAPNRLDFDYNCILAWVDNGIMDGNILYTYFRVDNDTIVWTPNSIKVRSNHTSVSTVSGVSAAFFNDSFWLAWKTIDGDVKYTRTQASEYSWAATVSKNRTDVIDPPTWLYVAEDTKEAALIWSEHDDI